MSMTEIPSAVATYFGIDVISAQLILSIIIILLLLVPAMILSNGKNAPVVWLLMIFFGYIIALSLGWAPFWVLVMIIALVAMGIAFLGTKAVTGE